jgi:hypothetical protein
MEQQAFGRVHRMGQTKEAHFARMMVKNTVDERLAMLQAEKLKMIEQTIMEHDSSKLSLTAEEIAPSRVGWCEMRPGTLSILSRITMMGRLRRPWGRGRRTGAMPLMEAPVTGTP